MGAARESTAARAITTGRETALRRLLQGATASDRVPGPAPAAGPNRLLSLLLPNLTWNAVAQRLDLRLTPHRREQSERRRSGIYRFDPEIPPVTPLRLKVDVNTCEHFCVWRAVSPPTQMSPSGSPDTRQSSSC
jgi:hypothetical protein